MTQLKLIRLPHSEGLELPSYETSDAAGMDLRAAVPDKEPIELNPGKRALVPTGLIMEIPSSFEGQIRPRSGLAYKNGITCLNTPGTIDEGYRGEVGVILINHGSDAFTVEKGMKVAQMIIKPVVTVDIEEVDELSDTHRGEGGFGSTGFHKKS